MQAHKTSSFYIGIMLKLRLSSPLVNVHGIGCLPWNGIHNPTKASDPNGCYIDISLIPGQNGKKDNAKMFSIIT